MPLPAPTNETQRLAALHALDIVDSAPESAYDEITELAAQICGCPVSYISFIDDERRWLKARYGLPAEVTNAPRENAVCTTTICGAELLVVPDLSRDPRFENSPMAALTPPCRFYCGMPLITDEGYALGTLCVMDFEPRQLSFAQTEALRMLSHQVLAQLELRRKLIEYGHTIKEMEQARAEAALERARAEELLRNVLPAPIADELKRSGMVQPRYTRSATILFADIQGFTLLAERTEPARLINLLDGYFSALDEIGARHGLEKVKTMGDAYMAVAGVLAPDRRHAIDVCLAALEMRARLDHLKTQGEATGDHGLQLRIGIHTGPVISGVVGNRRMSFDIWGDAVNTAWFMEAFGIAGRINVSETVAGHIHGLFDLEPRGPIEAKHHRAHQMFFLNGLKKEYSRNGDGHLPNDHFLAEYSRIGGSRLAPG
ncbi:MULTISPECIES: adenylate/guanylate cyclase domain-containing protein [unclassified Bradyrhizobium]|uniref:adenylate/guanylate cyclase domain-containing protein n=1 Tax=unclassified Bradyrhizobium TaxID=2631580 RepID=UPI00247ABB4A|nr:MULTISPECIES: adenylate/guanylate cyclase domain-containing protein [unclassified Bradyrhizobium]WGR68079.1 GAF domain-containing protein [Bradyrhizobium sp. ISRA426]WGR80134.1 GAF domain-containing protein [Bradyrhizobium sp. ISRA430]WGR83319.1 GAF domain-containing protein [Bradyrhizobium sp. ISRA432]